MKVLIFFILCLIPSIVQAQCKDCHLVTININEEVIKTAKSYSWVREKTNRNDNPEIDKWLKNCGLGKGYSYCQAYYNSMNKETYSKYNLKSPWPMYAGVAREAEACIKQPFIFKVISTKKMSWGIDNPEPGDLASFKHGSSLSKGFGYQGHAALVLSANKDKTVNTIEGNTKAGAGGDQSGTKLGDFTGGQEGVYFRVRSIGLNSTFPIMYFIRTNKVKYEL